MWTLLAAFSLVSMSADLPPATPTVPAAPLLAQWLDPADEAAARGETATVDDTPEPVDKGFEWFSTQRLLAAAVIGVPTVAMAAAAPYILSFGLLSPVFPLIAVLLPGMVAGAASLLVTPPQLFWISALAGSLGTLGGLFLGALAGFGALGVVPPSVVNDDRNAILFLPTMAVVTAVSAGSLAAAAGYFSANPDQE